MQDFVDLHQHSCFSFLDAWGTPQQIVERAAELGRKAVALTDHASVSGLIALEKACKANNIKPIYGVEAYTVPDAQERVAHRNHLTILAKNKVGYENLMRLVSASWKEGFYIKPRIDSDMLMAFREGLIILSGCYSGSISEAYHKGDIETALRSIATFKKYFHDDYYLEMQMIDLTYKYNQFLYSTSRDMGVPIVLTNDNHFVEKGQEARQGVLRRIRGQEEDTLNLIETQYLLSVDEIKEMAKKYEGIDWQEATDNTMAIADKINFDIPKIASVAYDDKSKPSDVLLLERCKKSQYWELVEKNPVYKQRLERELDTIKQKHFSDYFLYIADFLKFMHDNNILTDAGRGSSAGSLVCYLLGITLLDPIQYGLMFERFLDVSRIDMPDIDIDIEAQRIEDVKQYVYRRFGTGKAASIATYTEFKGRNAVSDIARIYKVPEEAAEIFKNAIVEYTESDDRRGFSLEDTIKQNPDVQKVIEQYPDLAKACWLEGQYRNMGKHAAGLVVSSEELYKTSAIYSRDGEDLICWDMKDFDRLNLLKVDLLKLKTLDVIKKVCELIGWSIDDIYNIPLDNEEVYNEFQKGDMLGIFQFDGYATYKILSQVKIRNLADIAVVNALGRPGTLMSDATKRYIEAKRTGKPVDAIPEIAPYTQDTAGEIVYQEQVMQIVRELGNFSWEQTCKLRKIMGKTLGTTGFDSYKEAFLEGARSHGIPEATADKIWERMLTFGAYAFNKSHAYSYGVLIYWCMYLRYYYPQQFYFATLVYEDATNTNNIFRLLLKLRQFGHIYLPNVNKSQSDWTLIGNDVYMGLKMINGFGEAVAREIVAHAPYTDMEDLANKTQKKIVNAARRKQIEENNMLEDNEYIIRSCDKLLTTRKDFVKIEQILSSDLPVNTEIMLRAYIREREMKQWGDKPELWANALDETGGIRVKIGSWLFSQIQDSLAKYDESYLFNIKGKMMAGKRLLVQHLEVNK